MYLTCNNVLQSNFLHIVFLNKCQNLPDLNIQDFSAAPIFSLPGRSFPDFVFPL